MPTAKRSTATGKRAAAKKTSAKAPAADAGEQTVAGQASDDSEPTASEPLPSSTEGTAAVSKRVLLVDDDAEIVESMRTVLESRGYEILVARDGNQGLAMAESEDPDLVVLDMMMPKRSGFLVLEKLRRSRPVPVRVIMITANEGSRHKAYAEMLGVDYYIRKPFAIDRLLESVDRLLAN